MMLKCIFVSLISLLIFSTCSFTLLSRSSRLVSCCAIYPSIYPLIPSIWVFKLSIIFFIPQMSLRPMLSEPDHHRTDKAQNVNRTGSTKNRVKNRLTKKYIKYSYFVKQHIYSCAYIWIQTICTQICKVSHIYSMFGCK